MARHIMAVCVVCLLCADRIPCEQHIIDHIVSLNSSKWTTDSKNGTNNSDSSSSGSSFSPGHMTSRAYEVVSTRIFRRSDPLTTHNQLNGQDTIKQKQESDIQSKHQDEVSFKAIQSHELSRKRRHAGHNHAEASATNSPTTDRRPELTNDFLQRIFDEYGRSDGTISINQFRLILERLNLYRLIETEFSRNLTFADYKNETAGETCISHSTLVHHIKKHNHLASDHNHITHHHHHDDDGHDHDLEANSIEDSTDNKSNNIETSSSYNEVHNKISDSNNVGNCSSSNSSSSDINSPSTILCSSPKHVSDSDNHSNQDDNDDDDVGLNKQDMLNLCPILLYHMASPLDAERSGCIDKKLLSSIDEKEKLYESSKPSADTDRVKAWVYSFATVFVCSTMGLVGVAIIPFMETRYYKQIIQYLVSLAVGTMTGDALLHLLPHSIIGQSEQNMVFKGLTCMGGIIFFYMTEHGLTMISEWRRRVTKKETKKPSRAKVVRDPDSAINNSVAGDKLCKSKYSSYPYCYDEIALDTKTDVWMHLGNVPAIDGNEVIAREDSLRGSERKRNGKSEVNPNEIAASESLLYSFADLNHHHHSTQHNHSKHSDAQHQNHLQHEQSHLSDCNTISNELDHSALNDVSRSGVAALNGVSNKDKLTNNDTVTVILREHESSHHGHSHKHGHVHSPPESLSAVAWMIIMGDGLHNFTDGMAIGAAFAENIAGGFSTSLAVFCHELPHELGDFAILLKAGMSVKSAVYYNLLTGILSFVGMAFGLIFGQSQDAAQWMFAAAAGLFIYIALVDMMPELSSAHKSLQQLTLQIFGMATGISLMLLIAIYEGDLMNVFTTT